MECRIKLSSAHFSKRVPRARKRSMPPVYSSTGGGHSLLTFFLFSFIKRGGGEYRLHLKGETHIPKMQK